jgi:branched-chain amino acid transport system ATP-binding protein
VSLLQLEGLHRSFGGVRAVDDLTLAFSAGPIQSIIGPNGAGKTTLFNLITGVLAPGAGRIRLEGADIAGRPPFVVARRGIARTFQNLQVFLNMSVRENVLVGRHRHLAGGLLATLLRTPAIRRSEAAARARADEILAEVGLATAAEQPADRLPYGALRRLDIARALATEPRLLLLDEPAAGCNARESAEVAALIRRIAAAGVTVLLVEHDMRLVMNLSERIVVLDHGRLLADGTAEEIRRDPRVIEAYLGSRAAPGPADAA